MSDTSDPVFPDITPSRVVRSHFHVIEDSDITSNDDLNALLRDMYEHPEHNYYFYIERDKGGNRFVTNAEKLGLLQYLSEDFFYYRHPNYQRDYVQIEEHKIKWAWEKKAFTEGPMFIQITLALTKKSEREIERKVNEEISEDNNPLILKPSFFGFGIDLHKLKSWLAKKFKKET